MSFYQQFRADALTARKFNYKPELVMQYKPEQSVLGKYLPKSLTEVVERKFMKIEEINQNQN